MHLVIGLQRKRNRSEAVVTFQSVWSRLSWALESWQTQYDKKYNDAYCSDAFAHGDVQAAESSADRSREKDQSLSKYAFEASMSNCPRHLRMRHQAHKQIVCCCDCGRLSNADMNFAVTASVSSTDLRHRPVSQCDKIRAVLWVSGELKR